MLRQPDCNDPLGQFFTTNAGKLERIVAHSINNARRELIEDACANAWAILLRRDDITLDARGFSWLTTVAINEALRLLRRTRGETPVGTFQADTRGHDDTDVPEPGDRDGSGADERALELIEHAERVEAFRQLKPREREALYLKALGHSYTEIARLSGVTRCRRRLPRGAVL